jgi:hypothetical protein
MTPYNVVGIIEKSVTEFKTYGFQNVKSAPGEDDEEEASGEEVTYIHDNERVVDRDMAERLIYRVASSYRTPTNSSRHPEGPIQDITPDKPDMKSTYNRLERRKDTARWWVSRDYLSDREKLVLRRLFTEEKDIGQIEQEDGIPPEESVKLIVSALVKRRQSRERRH